MNTSSRDHDHTASAVLDWRPISEFVYVPGTKPPEVLTIDARGDYRVALYVPRISSRSPPWWASVPGRWLITPTHFAPLSPPSSPAQVTGEGSREEP